MEVKLCIGYKGKSYNKIITDNDFNIFRGKKISDKVIGLSDLKGYEFLITGGSDKAGFPIRKDIEGTLRRKALLSKGPGVHINRKGMRIRKSVRGNTISDDIAQINLKILKEGERKIEEIFGKEEAKEEKKVEEVKEEKIEKKEKPKKEEKEKKPKEESKKEEVKKEVNSFKLN